MSITWRGWWDASEREQSPEPWEKFTLLAHGEQAGDTREATEEDLRLAGYVPAREVERLRGVLAAARDYLEASQRYGSAPSAELKDAYERLFGARVRLFERTMDALRNEAW